MEAGLWAANPGVDVRETGSQSDHDADAQLEALGYA